MTTGTHDDTVVASNDHNNLATTQTTMADEPKHSSIADSSSAATATQEESQLSAADPEKEEAERQQAALPKNDIPKDDGSSPLQKVPSQAAKMSRKKIAIIMFALCIALFLAALDTTIITTALPTISEHFNASQAGYTWIGSAYLLANSSTVPVWGKLSDIFGRKPILLLANVIFLVGSLICALSNSIAMLLVGRAVSGAAGGGLVVLVNICISDLFSMRERALYYALVGMTWAVASAVGPILGGVFTEEVSWRWCFYINLPFDGLAFIILLFFLNIETPKTSLRAGLAAIDWVGSLTIVGGTLMLLFGLEFGGNTHPWDSATVICLIIFGVVVLGIFGINEWKWAKYPVIPLSILNNRSNIACLLVNACHGFVFIAGTYFLPLYFQTVLSASPIYSGVYTFALVIPLSLGSAATGIAIRKTGRYLELIRLGMACMTLGFGLYIDFKPYVSWPRIIIYQIIAGIGVGPNFQAPLIALQSNVAPRNIASATATFGFIRQLSTSISIVVGGVVYSNIMAKKHDYLVATVGEEVAAKIANGALGSDATYLDSLSPNVKKIVDAAINSSLQKMWIFYTCIAGLGIAMSFLVGKNHLSKNHTQTKTGLAEVEKQRLENDAQRRRSAAPPEATAENGVSTKETTEVS